MNDYLLQQINERRELLRIAGWDENGNSDDESLLGEVIPDDVISGILLAEVDSRKLSDSERLVMLNQLLVGGNETNYVINYEYVLATTFTARSLRPSG
ncbi:MAG: hypothetical protein Ct9H90mP11_02910 [Acidimicrobiales bacterium]|nr:MAG: hypothetical protein Ct9H90mP11_02910 [Acidimicrobiales bacterium]